MPETTVLVAMTRDRIIGQGGEMPWHLPEELRLFRELTLGNTLLMGRKTFQSLPSPLDGRNIIVVSRTLPRGAGYQVRPTFDEALVLATSLGKKIFFIGGVGVYRRAMPIADFMAISWIEGEYAGDVRFPEVDFSGWEILEETLCRGFSHVRYRRRGRDIKKGAV